MPSKVGRPTIAPELRRVQMTLTFAPQIAAWVRLRGTKRVERLIESAMRREAKKNGT